MITENIIKGQLIELKVQEALLRFGFDISVPLYNASRYDLIVDTGEELLKVQIKKSIGKTEHSFYFPCTTQNVRSKSQKGKHKYTSKEVDYFATVWKDKVYFVPIEEVSLGKTLREDSTSEQYLIENIFSHYKFLSDEQLYNYSKKNKNYCQDCGCEIDKNSTRCVSCNNKRFRVVERPDRETLKKLIREKSFTEIGRIYGVTDNAIRKWCDAEGLPRKTSEIKKISKEDWVLI